ncbi:urotensin-2 receptor [Engraulis encrasicolus]|uniref:urotensin-2 receptor n=1 Tax=Engraulis encrasicolus TaxID=184585 RepID=UPI002FD01BCD
MEFLGSVSLLSSPSPTSSSEPLFNMSSSSSSSPSLSPSPSTASTALFCFLLSLLSLLGIVGNLYTIGLLLLRRRGTRAGRRRRLWGGGAPSSASPCCCCCLPGSSFSSPSLSPSSSPITSSYSSSTSSSSSSLHLQVLSLALADLLYLSTAPFIVYDSLTPDWGFGEVGCRLLLSLDLLTMHASIFTLTAMSMDRYRAVADPLAASVSPSSGLLKVVLAWGVAVALSLPMMITLHLEDSGGIADGGTVGDVVGGDVDAGTRMLCVPAWDEQSSKTYLTILFCTSILAPGLAIGGLYSALAILYWRSQSSAAWSSGQDRVTQRAPRPKVLLLILGIVLAFWACFLPFWVWQLLPLYREDFLPSVPVSTQVTVNRILTGLTYGNSCVNPFFYTLLTGKRSRRNRQTISSSAPLCQKTSSIR